MTVQAYMLPISTEPIPGGLSLNQFLQTVLVGISGIPGALVRPEWQIAPPKQPDIDIDWLAFGVSIATPDANAFIGVTLDDQTISQRHETLEITCSLYGPHALDNYELIRDGFQIPANREALATANMGFVEVVLGRRLPDLVNERWVDKIVTSIFLRREIQRVYPILTLLSASGQIHTALGNEPYLLDWDTQN